MRRSLILFIIMCLFGMTLPSYAIVENDDQNSKYTYTNKVSVSMSITGSETKMTAALEGKPVVTKIKCTLTIQKYNSGSWSAIQSWSKEVNAKVLSLKKTYNVSHGTYRTKAIFKVYKNSSYETVTKYSSSVTY